MFPMRFPPVRMSKSSFFLAPRKFQQDHDPKKRRWSIEQVVGGQKTLNESFNILQPKEKTPPRSHKTLKILKCRNLYLFGRFWNHLGSIEYQGSGIHSGIVWILRKVPKFSWESCSSSSFTVAMARACLGHSLNTEKVTIFSMIKQVSWFLFWSFWDNQQNPMLRTCIYIWYDIQYIYIYVYMIRFDIYNIYIYIHEMIVYTWYVYIYIYIYIYHIYRWYIEYVHLPGMSSIGVSPIFIQNRIKENRTVEVQCSTFSARCYATPWPHNPPTISTRPKHSHCWWFNWLYHNLKKNRECGNMGELLLILNQHESAISQCQLINIYKE